MSEIWTAETWLYSKLHGDSTLMALTPGGVHTWPVPALVPNESGVMVPLSGAYVLYQMQTANDIRGVGPARIGVDGLWLVRVVAETNSFGGNLLAAADRIDVLLQAASGTVTAGVIWACVRTEPFQLVELTEGGKRQFRHLGGQYRIWVQ